MKVGRNDSCPCGSGKKYKKCCLHQKQPETIAVTDLSIKQRNIVLANAIGDIFGFNKGKTWDDFRRDISNDQVREMYKVIATIWPPKTDLSSLLPRPDGKLRSLYVGHYRPEPSIVMQNIIRYSLYTDQILVILPFMNPWCIAKDYNPIEHPEEYKEDTIKSVYFFLSLLPWIVSDLVNVIPDPGDFDYQLRIKTWDLASERNKSKIITDQDVKEMEPYTKEDFKRTLLRLPNDSLVTKFKELNPALKEQEIKGIIEYVEKLREKDPLYLNQPITNSEGQYNILRTGVNVDMAFYIAQITGAYPYTNISRRWNEILSLTNKLPNEGEIWSPLTKSFQGLEFKFLNNVDVDFARSIRSDGRLESFRLFLRKVWRTVDGSPEVSKVDKIAVEFSKELTDEFKKAEQEWKEIDRKLVNGSIKGPLVSMAGSIITGNMSWEIPAAGFAIGAIYDLLSTKFSRDRFRKNVPMSVFLDLKAK